MADAVLIINAGSSSLKFSVYRIGEQDQPRLLAKGQVEGIGTSPRLLAEDAEGQMLVDRCWPGDRGAGHAEFFRVAGSWLREQFSDTALLGVGHRVVHGGVDYAQPVRIDPAVLEKLEALCPLAPLHQPHNLAGIRAVAAVLPDLPQVACFDTAFHRAHPDVADWYALPRRFYDDGIRRYGFHGLSYEYLATVLPEIAPDIASGRVVVAHLGSGASMCAMRAGRSIDSTMGFTALDGLPMGTRIERTMGLAMLAIGCVLVLRPFFIAVCVALILMVATWPACRVTAGRSDDGRSDRAHDNLVPNGLSMVCKVLCSRSM